ncbi:MAG: bestrophin family ion channel, partial [Myxococcota bacterium]
MHIGRRYTLFDTLRWSSGNLVGPLVYSGAVTAIHQLTPVDLGMPWLPVSAIAISVAFYLGFKNSASYDRLWEARKIWGAIVNASRSWAYSARDLVASVHLPPDSQIEPGELVEFRRTLVLRHVAWLDALRHQLRRVQTWEHRGAMFDRYRTNGAVEYVEDLGETLAPHLSKEELDEVMARINPAAHLIANQSRHLADLRDWGVLDGFGHMELQAVLRELMAQQGKAERIKNFP